MKKLFCAFICGLFFLTTMRAGFGFRLDSPGAPAAPAASSYTYEIQLSLDDDASNVIVTNGGTNGYSWASEGNTSLYHTMTHKEGTGAFDFTSSAPYIYQEANWTANKFVWIFWWQPANATAPAIETHLQLGTSGIGIGANVAFLWRMTGASNFRFYGQGPTGSYGYIETTNFSPGSAIWYCIKLSVDASASPWTVSGGFAANPLTCDETSTSFTNFTWGSWSADPTAVTAFAGPPYIGNGTGSYAPNAIFDFFRMRVGP
ncbi:MAG: hypothetical protein ABSG91_15255 [Syntrophobacteraceae bacterium]|jgi:hypothetical protein